MPGEERLRTKVLWVDKSEATERILVNLFELREMLGDRLVAHLLRAMIWADRIVSASFADFTMRKEQATGPGMVRNAETILMLVVGCLSEAARAIDDAMKEGLGDLVPTTDPDMSGLLAIANRWNQDEDGRLVRNKMAFHVDSAEIVRGPRGCTLGTIDVAEAGRGAVRARAPSAREGRLPRLRRGAVAARSKCRRPSISA